MDTVRIDRPNDDKTTTGLDNYATLLVSLRYLPAPVLCRGPEENHTIQRDVGAHRVGAPSG